MGAKQAKGDAAERTDGKYKLAVSIDHEVSKRFKTFCTFFDLDVSREVEAMMRTRMLGFRVSITGMPKPRATGDVVAGDDQSAETPDLRVAG